MSTLLPCEVCGGSAYDTPYVDPTTRREYLMRYEHKAGCQVYLSTPRRHDDVIAHLLTVKGDHDDDESEGADD